MLYTTFTLFLAICCAFGQPAKTNGKPAATSVNPATSTGVFGPFKAVRAPAASAQGAPTTVSSQKAQQLQQACSAWVQDTGMVSNFLNLGQGQPVQTLFQQMANVAFNAEVDELTHKAVLDGIIGNDPTVSIANLTLTNGSFQSVVSNLQIMSVQGRSRVGLINAINSVRCTQILPSIGKARSHSDRSLI
jgi:hypothetical protein